jgi:hypothetical protein
VLKVPLALLLVKLTTTMMVRAAVSAAQAPAWAALNADGPQQAEIVGAGIINDSSKPCCVV